MYELNYEGFNIDIGVEIYDFPLFSDEIRDDFIDEDGDYKKN